MSKKEYNFEDSEQGSVVKSPAGKTRVTIRIDTDILNWFREQVHAAGGGSYQTLMNEALRDYVHNRDEVLENMLRKVIREELKTMAG